MPSSGTGTMERMGYVRPEGGAIDYGSIQPLERTRKDPTDGTSVPTDNIKRVSGENSASGLPYLSPGPGNGGHGKSRASKHKGARSGGSDAELRGEVSDLTRKAMEELHAEDSAASAGVKAAKGEKSKSGRSPARRALDEPSPLLDAYENRMFLPALPEQWQRDAGQSPKKQDQVLEHRMKTMTRELLALQSRAEQVMAQKDAEILRLRFKSDGQQDVIDRLTKENKQMQRELGSAQADHARVEAERARKLTAANLRVASLEAKLANQEELFDRQDQGATEQLDALRRERQVLASALATVAQACMGGEGADPAAVGRDAEEAMRAGDDPLPRKPQAWLKFDYTADEAVAGGGSPKRRALPLMGDGMRAISSLVAAVERLHVGREEARSGERDALDQMCVLADVITRVEEEYESVKDALTRLEEVVGGCARDRAYQGLAAVPAPAGSSVADRLEAVRGVSKRMAGELGELDERVKEHGARVMELEFYGKLQGRIVEEAKNRTRA
ncbi:unnamed protein product [Pedinophyceae sp. YPF-701]|nr:unnamed protein product [Pedinophyceae sp. YPF-701]